MQQREVTEEMTNEKKKCVGQQRGREKADTILMQNFTGYTRTEQSKGTPHTRTYSATRHYPSRLEVVRGPPPIGVAAPELTLMCSGGIAPGRPDDAGTGRDSGEGDDVAVADAVAVDGTPSPDEAFDDDDDGPDGMLGGAFCAGAMGPVGPVCSDAEAAAAIMPGGRAP
jgi:hypothetical protein